jgi:putative transcriptional regulator
MPIIVNLESIMMKSEIPFPVLVEKAGITRSNLTVLKSNKAKLIRFSTLDSICRTLNCQPGDILEYIPDKENTTGGARNL